RLRPPHAWPRCAGCGRWPASPGREQSLRAPGPGRADSRRRRTRRPARGSRQTSLLRTSGQTYYCPSSVLPISVLYTPFMIGYTVTCVTHPGVTDEIENDSIIACRGLLHRIDRVSDSHVAIRQMADIDVGTCLYRNMGRRNVDCRPDNRGKRLDHDHVR